MIIGRVINNVVASRKYDSIQGVKFLLIEDIYSEKKEIFVAGDNIGAGIGEIVMVCKGANVKYTTNKDIPIDAMVIGIVDEVPIVE